MWYSSNDGGLSENYKGDTYENCEDCWDSFPSFQIDEHLPTGKRLCEECLKNQIEKDQDAEYDKLQIE